MDNVVESLAGGLAGYGVLGLWALYLIWQSYLKDQVIAKRDERINDLMDRSAQREVDATKTLTELAMLIRAMGGRA